MDAEPNTSQTFFSLTNCDVHSSHLLNSLTSSSCARPTLTPWRRIRLRGVLSTASTYWIACPRVSSYVSRIPRPESACNMSKEVIGNLMLLVRSLNLELDLYRIAIFGNDQDLTSSPSMNFTSGNKGSRGDHPRLQDSQQLTTLHASYLLPKWFPPWPIWVIIYIYR